MGIYGFIPLLWHSASQLPTAATRASAVDTFLNFQLCLQLCQSLYPVTATEHLPTAIVLMLLWIWEGKKLTAL